PNVKDINDQTPMHIAVIQGHASIVKLLINSKADTMCRDIFGNTPSSYCRNSGSDELKKIFNNPTYNKLVSLARGEFSIEEEKKACYILMNYTGVLGCLSKSNAIDIKGQNGKTPLMEAIIHSSYNIIKILLQLGANPYYGNTQSINSFVWSDWIGNPKKNKLITNDLSIIDFCDKDLVAIKDQNIMTNLIWNAKIFTVNIIACGITNLSPQHIIALYMYSTNTDIFKMINNSLIAENLGNMKLFTQC